MMTHPPVPCAESDAGVVFATVTGLVFVVSAEAAMVPIANAPARLAPMMILKLW
jgi:hypothetical protein